MKHEVNRQVSDEEHRLWTRAKDAWASKEYDYISITEVAVSKVGIHQTRSRQIVATWDNEGLVVSGAKGSYDSAALTEYGRQVDEIVSTHESGESWR